MDKYQLKAQRESEQLRALVELARNPIAEMIIGSLFILWITHDPNGKWDWWNIQDWSKILAAGGMGATMMSIIGLQQLAPVVPYFSDTIKDLIPALPGG